MSVEERRRIRLFERWVETWGQEDAETMLELHPPPGRDPATSDDVAGIHARIDRTDARIDGTNARIDAFRREVDLKLEATTSELIAVFREEIHRAVVTQTRITVFSMVTAFAAVSALALGIS